MEGKGRQLEGEGRHLERGDWRGDSWRGRGAREKRGNGMWVLGGR